MWILRNPADVAALDDEGLRTLIERRLEARERVETFDADLDGPYIVMVPDDDLATVETAAGLPLLVDPVTGAAYGDPAFSPIFELVIRHPRCYEMVFVPGGGDDGVTVFVPRDPRVDHRLLTLCAEYAVPEPVAV
ncbi:hypothetical protein [Thauera sp.]|uniref:hypothetical protein n=1 Tax=Thauera sp. TaxID=1905334 RepID=UPI002C7E35E0|nr:hypothetical protein [Thauera sp.]HRO36450.1 hypothetical protein [Thauera sp.]